MDAAPAQPGQQQVKCSALLVAVPPETLQVLVISLTSSAALAGAVARASRKTQSPKGAR